MLPIGKYYYNDNEVTQEEFLNLFKDGKYQDKDGTVFWRQNYVLHREDGPAIIYPYGQMEWWVSGVLHRDPQEGAAIEFSNGGKDYWEHGKRLHPWKQYWLNTVSKKLVLWLMKIGIISICLMLCSCEDVYPNMVQRCSAMCEINNGWKMMHIDAERFYCVCNNQLSSDWQTKE